MIAGWKLLITLKKQDEAARSAGEPPRLSEDHKVLISEVTLGQSQRAFCWSRLGLAVI
jgi:hypothetical protein